MYMECVCQALEKQDKTHLELRNVAELGLIYFLLFKGSHQNRKKNVKFFSLFFVGEEVKVIFTFFLMLRMA